MANAVGAAIAQVSGEVDRVFTGLGREEAIEAASNLARERAISAGALLKSVSGLGLPLVAIPAISFVADVPTAVAITAALV